ncbi:MAG TPA: VOC family protein [Balneolaceae bacterium]
MATQTVKKMKNVVAWFEVPAIDIKRAKKFYQNIFDIEMDDIELDNFKMSMFPAEDGGVGGALCQHEEYKPSHEGTLVYFNSNPDLQTVVDKIEEEGGKVLQPKTKITDEYGYMAIFEDTEGNRIGLHSDN